SVEAYTSTNNLPSPFYNIETKSTAATDNIYHPGPAEFVTHVMAVIEEKKIQSRTIIQSFDVRTLQYLHREYPTVKTALLVEDEVGLYDHLEELGFTPTIYSPDYHLVNTQLVRDCKDSGMQLIPWTVNEIAKMKELRELGVD